MPGIKLRPKQREYIRQATHRYNVKTGATGSGKTYLDIVYTIPKRIIERSNKSGIIVLLGNTRGTLQRNIIEPMQEIYTKSLVSDIKQDNTALLFGEKCYCLGADKVSQASKIQGATFKYVYGDELTTWSEDVFTMLKSRLRTPYSCMDATCNPDNPRHWVRDFLDSDSDVYEQQYCIDDGALPPEVIASLKRDYEGTIYYNRFILGQWVAAEGIIYRQFADNLDRYVRTTYDDGTDIAIRRAVIGVDFGGNGSAHAFSLVGFTPTMGAIIVLEEYYRKEQISPAQLERDFIDFVRLCQTKYFVSDCYCDSAEQTLIQGLIQTAGRERISLNIYNARKGDINERIRALNMLMAAGRFYIAPHCKHTIEALQTAVWDSKSPTKDRRLDDGKHNIDSLDALEYAFEREIHSLITARVI